MSEVRDNAPQPNPAMEAAKDLVRLFLSLEQGVGFTEADIASIIRSAYAKREERIGELEAAAQAQKRTLLALSKDQIANAEQCEATRTPNDAHMALIARDFAGLLEKLAEAAWPQAGISLLERAESAEARVKVLEEALERIKSYSSTTPVPAEFDYPTGHSDGFNAAVKMITEQVIDQALKEKP